MDYISELKRKAEMYAADLTLDRVIQTCRQVELTTAHLKLIDLKTNK
jgi:hypothetical protein